MTKQVLPDKVKSKLEEAGYKVTSEDNGEVFFEKVTGNRKVTMSMPADFPKNTGTRETSDFFEGHWYCLSFDHFRDRDFDDVMELNAKFLGGMELPDIKSKLEEAGYKVTSEDDDGAYYVKQVGNKKVGISVPANFDEENWAITTAFTYEAGHWFVESYGDFPASDLDEVVELNAKFLGGMDMPRGKSISA